MKRSIVTVGIVFTLCALARAQQPPGKPGKPTFDLNPALPPTPALKHQLMFDDLADRHPGNAAMLYLDAILLVKPQMHDTAHQALSAFDAGDMKTFASLADSLDLSSLFEELDLASRRETCDWQPPFRERGVRTLLPHISPLVGVARLVKVRALRQIEDGKLDDALATLRLGYVLAENVGREPVLISGLVSLRITSMMNECLVQLMNRPEAPNLYWALAELPARQAVLRNSLDGERLASITASIPNLARFKAGEMVSAEQWREVLDYVSELATIEEGLPKNPGLEKESSPEVLSRARQEYARGHHLTSEQTARIDATIVLGSFYFNQYEIACDDMYKLRGLPYPQLLDKSKRYGEEVAKLIKEQPANPFARVLPVIDKPIWTFARTDRQLAAFGAVEAVRSYAAAHDMKLPARLDDITDTPAPRNPVTGKAFEYRANADGATLSDTQSPEPFTFTIHIRKSGGRPLAMLDRSH